MVDIRLRLKHNAVIESIFHSCLFRKMLKDDEESGEAFNVTVIDKFKSAPRNKNFYTISFDIH